MVSLCLQKPAVVVLRLCVLVPGVSDEACPKLAGRPMGRCKQLWCKQFGCHRMVLVVVGLQLSVHMPYNDLTIVVLTNA
jgi:hypothetical protein